jgi:hypothetical protein
VTDDCDCPLNELRAAVKDYMRWESILFRSGVVMTQEQLNTASDAFGDARDRLLALVGDAE